MILRLIVLLIGLSGQTALAEEPSMPAEAPLNLPFKTLGGRMFWADVVFFHDWRIQKNVFTGHYRLLDGRDVRHAWGTIDECRARLKAIRAERELPVMTGEAVVLLHGMARSSKSTSTLRKHLRDEGMQVFAFDYPSTQVTIEEAADLLSDALASLEGIDRIHLVGFSMGGLVVRSYLHRHPHEKVGRVLLIGTPNHGAEMADLFRKTLIYRLALGPAGQQLSMTQDAGVAPRLPPPDVEFGLIAGARGTEWGFNPLIPGDDDGTVAVDSVRLDGAADFITVPALHALILRHPRTHEATARFLRSGKFRETPEPDVAPR